VSAMSGGQDPDRSAHPQSTRAGTKDIARSACHCSFEADYSDSRMPQGAASGRGDRVADVAEAVKCCQQMLANERWRARNRMPSRATIDERVTWHLARQGPCARHGGERPHDRAM